MLEPYLGRSDLGNHAHRIVTGQRIMQAATDPFLGWGRMGRYDVYVRQMRDMKGSVEVEAMDGQALAEYASLCGWVLARGHARSGSPARIAGYLGRSESFDRAMVRFANRYADQNEADHAARWRRSTPAGSRGGARVLRSAVGPAPSSVGSGDRGAGPSPHRSGWGSGVAPGHRRPATAATGRPPFAVQRRVGHPDGPPTVRTLRRRLGPLAVRKALRFDVDAREVAGGLRAAAADPGVTWVKFGQIVASAPGLFG